MNRRNLILYLIICLAVSIGQAQEKDSANGKLYGYVYNASQETDHSKKVSLTGQEVVLHKYIDGKADDGPRLHTETDAKGRFEFADLKASKRFAYYPVAVVNGIEYYGGLVKLSADTLEKRSNIQAYETTQSDSSIGVAMHHIIVNPGVGVLQVKEVAIFSNRGKHTYVGNAPARKPGQKIVLRMNVPDKATDLQFGGDLMKCCAVVAGSDIFDTMAFKPGVRQETVSYVLPYDGNNVSLVKNIIYPSGSVDVFLPENSGQLNAPEFIPEGAFPIRGENYQRYNASNLKQGDVLTLTFTDLPTAPRDLRWLPPVVIAFVLLVGFVLLKARRKTIIPKAEADEQISEEPGNEKRQRLLGLILQLEESYENGRIEKDIYLKSKEAFTNEILALNEEENDDQAQPVEPKPEEISK